MVARSALPAQLCACGPSPPQVSQHPEAVAAIKEVQASVAAHSPHLAGACVEAATGHLTLGVLCLAGDEDRAAAVDALASLAGPLADLGLLAPLEVQLEGLSHFKNEVGRKGCAMCLAAALGSSLAPPSCTLLLQVNSSDPSPFGFAFTRY